MPPPDDGFRITNEVLYDQIDRLRVEVGDLKTQVRLAEQRMEDAIEEREAMRARIDKIEARLNGVFVGLGTGVIVGAYFLIERGLT